MEKITLKPHNIRAYNELCRILETKDRAAYISATGTGKSYEAGGSSGVRTDKEFASLRTVTSCNLAIKFRKKLACIE